MAHSLLSRRSVLITAGGGLIAAYATGGKASAAAGRCVLMPQSTEGPFYVDPHLQRSDITEGRPGRPLLLRLNILDAQGCGPSAGARVDVWHCDARGGYSSFDGRGGKDSRTYLRGSQLSDGNGSVLFRTIWPGWYQGRAPHVHFKVLLRNSEVLTAQIYFPDEINARVYADPAYRRGWSEAASNARDGIFRGAGGAGLAAISEQQGAMVATLDVGIGRKT